MDDVQTAFLEGFEMGADVAEIIDSHGVAEDLDDDADGS